MCTKAGKDLRSAPAEPVLHDLKRYRVLSPLAMDPPPKHVPPLMVRCHRGPLGSFWGGKKDAHA